MGSVERNPNIGTKSTNFNLRMFLKELFHINKGFWDDFGDGKCLSGVTLIPGGTCPQLWLPSDIMVTP